VTVIVERRGVENAGPWTKVRAEDWDGDGRRTPRVAIAATAAVDRADLIAFQASLLGRS